MDSVRSDNKTFDGTENIAWTQKIPRVPDTSFSFTNCGLDVP